MFRKLLKFREMAKNLHKVEIRSGRGTSFWYDHWSDMGRLIELVGSRAGIEFGIPLEATVHSAFHSTRRRRHRLAIFTEIEDLINQTRTRTRDLEHLEDIHLWRRRGDRFQKYFSSNHTWAITRVSQPRVDWTKLVWFTHATPKQSFIVWLTCLDRLHTMDWITRWNGGTDPICVLCKAAMESQTHLFFTCSYSQEIWRSLMGRLMGLLYTHDWGELLIRVGSYQGPRTKKFLLKYGLQSAVYWIWQERNNRRHGQQQRSTSILQSILDHQIRNRLHALQEEGMLTYREGFQLWMSTRV